MVTFDKSIGIGATPHAVWRALARPAEAPGWCPGLARATVRGAPQGSAARPGLLVLLERVDLGLALSSVQEVVIADAPRRLVTRQREGDFAACDVRLDITPTRMTATTLRARVRVELPFVLPRFVLDEDVRRHYSRVLDAALLNLKDVAEGARPGMQLAGAAFNAPHRAAVPHEHGVHGSPSRDAVHAR